METRLFGNDALKKLVIPLVFEQLLAVTIGLADTVMVSVGGENAVSAVSLVDTFSQLMIALFSAFATGGAVVASQYIGLGDRKRASESGKQLLFLCSLFSVLLIVLLLPFRHRFLSFLFGAISPSILNLSTGYFFWILLSFPALGIYSAIAALFRSMGNSKVTLKISLVMNLVNIGGNALFIYGFGLSAVGAGIATMLSRMVSAIIALVLIRKKDNIIRLEGFRSFHIDRILVGKILYISIPSGIENSLFQVGKLIVQTFIASLGTMVIAANAVCNSIISFSTITGQAIGLASITVVGQCIGAGKTDEAGWQAKRLLGITYLTMAFTCLVIFVCSPILVSLFNLSDKGREIAISVIRQCMIASAIIWPLSFEFPNSLRAAGDARFTMGISLTSMFCFRVVCAYLLAIVCKLGLNGIWMGMYIDWTFRAICFVLRFKSGKWKRLRLV